MSFPPPTLFPLHEICWCAFPDFRIFQVTVRGEWHWKACVVTHGNILKCLWDNLTRFCLLVIFPSPSSHLFLVLSVFKLWYRHVCKLSKCWYCVLHYIIYSLTPPPPSINGSKMHPYYPFTVGVLSASPRELGFFLKGKRSKKLHRPYNNNGIKHRHTDVFPFD